ncbi:MAG: histidinol-phosphate transaminase [Bacteroidales bacterium]
MDTISNLLRPNILKLKAYSTARDEYQGTIGQFMDANENPVETGINRYPDPYQKELKSKIAGLKKIATENIFVGNGSDEAIDVLYRVFCRPGIDNVIGITPSYGMYKVAADINDIEYREYKLDKNFNFNATELLKLVDANTKMLFLCSPNNPSGNLLDQREIGILLKQFEGILIIDEAYIDFATSESYTTLLSQYPRLVILQTLSKAWGAAAIRLGLAFASAAIITFMTRVKYPYNVNLLSQKAAIQTLNESDRIAKTVNMICSERDQLKQRLISFPFVEHVYPSDANFLLVRCFQATKLYNFLLKKEIIVRDRSSVPGCESCLRVSVGTPEENQKLIEALLAYELLL